MDLPSDELDLLHVSKEEGAMDIEHKRQGVRFGVWRTDSEF
jgi:hypothetical protein